jgi:hypothetical protein
MSKKKVDREKIKADILTLLRPSRVSLSLLDIQKVIDGVDKSILKELISEGKIEAVSHFEHNSNKTFTHPETHKIEKIKGTHIYKYKIVK